MTSSLRRRSLAVASAVIAATVALPTVASAVPDEVPDRGPLISEPMRRGGLLVEEVGSVPPTAKTIDGDATDWVGEASRIGGTSRYDAGEHVYSDFVHDAWGADDGQDAERLQVTGTLAEAEPRTTRLDALSQALGAQFGAPRPVGAGEAFGDVLANDVADVTTVRWASAEDGDLDLLVELSNLTDASELGVLVLADVSLSSNLDDDVVFERTGLTSERFDTAVLVTDGAVRSLTPGSRELTEVSGQAVVSETGWDNLLEARLPADLVGDDGVLRATVITGRWDGETFVPANVAYRDAEPVAGMYNDQRQALALLAGNVDEFTAEIAVADLESGRSESVRPGPGYHERTFESDPAISVELREDLDDIYEDTVWQRYALFVPSDHDPSEPEQATFWMHYRGGKAHSGGAWSPRLFTQLGEEVGGIVVTPHGRGERRWYEGSSHQDFWEVYDDLHETFDIDPQRRYLSGYSMGGHGSPMMAMLYPDRFAGAYLQAAAIGRDLFDVSVNAEHVPFWFDVSAQDALVAVNQDLAMELNGLGYRYVANTFVAGEHYTQAILDEWAAGARYLQQHETPANPRRVTYRVVPSLIDTINDGRGEPTGRRFSPDGAWWVDGIVVAEGADHGTVTAEARTLPGEDVTTQVSLGDVQPLDYSVPSVRHGQAWTGTTAAVEPIVDVDLAGVSAVTLDAARWGLAGDGATEVRIVSDEDAAVALTGIPADLVLEQEGVTVEPVDGAHTVAVAPGETTIVLRSAFSVAASAPASEVVTASAAAGALPATGGGHAAIAAGLLGGAVALRRGRG